MAIGSWQVWFELATGYLGYSKFPVVHAGGPGTVHSGRSSSGSDITAEYDLRLSQHRDRTPYPWSLPWLEAHAWNQVE